MRNRKQPFEFQSTIKKQGEAQRMKSEEDQDDEGMMQVMDGDVGDERRTLFPFSHMKRGLLPSFSQYHIFMCIFTVYVCQYQMIESVCIR